MATIYDQIHGSSDFKLMIRPLPKEQPFDKIGEIFGIFWKCFHALASSIDHLLKRARYAGPSLSIRCITVFILSGEFLKKP